MKHLSIILAAIAVLLMNGCTGQPSFNKNSTEIAFVKGQPYNIPHNSSYLLDPISSKDSKRINSVGGNCSKGDVLWVTQSADKSKLGIETTYVKGLIQAGKMGCSSKLSKREYQHNLAKENRNAMINAQMAAQNSANLNSTLRQINADMAATTRTLMPRTHNVYVY